MRGRVERGAQSPPDINSVADPDRFHGGAPWNPLSHKNTLNYYLYELTKLAIQLVIS